MSELKDLLTVCMFGELRIRVNNLPIPRLSAKAQELFALLVVWSGEPISRKRLASTLWPLRQTNALGLLRTTLLELRKALGPAAARLPSEDRTTLQMDLSGAMIDVFEFDLAVKVGRADGIQTAVALYKQDLLVGWEAAWIQPERERRAKAYAELHRLARLFTPRAAGPLEEPPQGVATVRMSRDELPNTGRAEAVAEMRVMLAQNYATLERLEHLLDGLGGAEPTEDTVSRAEALYTLGVSKYIEGDFDGAQYCQWQALHIAEHLSNLSGFAIHARILQQLGRLKMNNDKDAARRYFQQAYDIQLRQHSAEQKSLVTSLLSLGDTAAVLPDAMEYYEQALRTAQANADEMGTAWSYLGLASRPLYEESWDVSQLGSTLSYIARALNGFSAIHDPTGLFAVFGWLARVCHLVGYSAGATRILELEAALRQDYSAPETVKDNVDSTSEFVAIRQSITDQVGREQRPELDWGAAVAEAERLISELPANARPGS